MRTRNHLSGIGPLAGVGVFLAGAGIGALVTAIAFVGRIRQLRSQIKERANRGRDHAA